MHTCAHTHTYRFIVFNKMFLFCQFVFMSVKYTLFNMSSSWENGFRDLSAISLKLALHHEIIPVFTESHP